MSISSLEAPSLFKRCQGLVTTFAVTVVSLIMETFIFWSLQSERWSLDKALFWHIIVVGLCLYLGRLLIRRGQDPRFIILQVLFLSVLGPFGALIVLLMIPLYIMFQHISTSTGALLSEIMPEESYTLSETIYERVVYGMDSFDPAKKPQAFQDILIYGTERQKSVAIERMLKHFKPEFYLSFTKALNDPNASIRVLAATAVTYINNIYSNRFQGLEARVKANPKDLDALFSFAKFCEEYAYILIMDKEGAEKTRLTAIDAYRRYLELLPNDICASISLGRLYFQINNPQETIQYLSPIMQKKGALPDEACNWFMRAQFRLKDYDTIRSMSRNEGHYIAGDSLEYDNIIDALVLWKRGLLKRNLALGRAYGE